MATSHTGKLSPSVALQMQAGHYAANATQSARRRRCIQIKDGLRIEPAVGGHMLFHKHRPSPPLSDYVEYLWYLADQPGHGLERIVPNGTFELVINLSENGFHSHESNRSQRVTRPPGAIVSGPSDRFVIIDTRDHLSLMGVHFWPGCALPFIGCRADEIGAGYVELEALWGEDARRLRERLCVAATMDVRLSILENALSAFLTRPPELRRDIHYALQMLRGGLVPVAQIAASIELSHRRFVEVFAAQVGTTPKLYSRIQRFQRAMRIATAGPVPSWGALALECGYFDQSHMYRDFQEFAGITPETLAQKACIPVKDGHIAVA